MMHRFLDLGRQPITNSFLTMDNLCDEYFYNLSVGFDDDTKLVSLVEFVERERMFNESYAHRASMSRTMKDAFKKVAYEIDEKFAPDKIMEIGSNDGVFITNYARERAIAIEPCGNLAKLTSDLGYMTYPEFWNRELAEEILAKHGQIDVVYSANTICHIEDLREVFDAVYHVLSDKGVFIFEDPYLLDVISNTSYDQFYDEHAHIFSVIALSNILMKSNLRIVRAEHLANHGGSMRIYATKDTNKEIPTNRGIDDIINQELEMGLDDVGTYFDFSARVEKSKCDLVRLMKKIKEDSKKIISYGATYKSATVFNYCGIGTQLIDYVIDTTPNKQGKLTPGMHIPIISPIGLNETVDYAYLGAWNFIEEIMAKERDFMERGGRFITHVPNVHITPN